MNRLQLKINHGGGGILSTKRQVDAAYIGSLALVSCILSTELHLDIFALTEPYTEYNEAFERVKIMLPDFDMDQYQLCNIATTPQLKVQSKISTSLSKIQYQEIINLLPTSFITCGTSSRARNINTMPANLLVQKLSFIGMQSSESGAWLTANPRVNANQLTNNQFSDSLRIRIGIPLFSFPFKCLCGEYCDEMGFHAYTCCKCKGERNERHQYIKIAVWNMISSFLPQVLKSNEPYLAPTFATVPPPDNDPESFHIPQRADLSVKD